MKLLRRILTVMVILATITVGVLFALQNTVMVPLDMLVYRFDDRSVSLWILLSFALGGVLGMLTFTGILIRQRATMRSADRQNLKLRSELDKLRTAGLKGSE